MIFFLLTIQINSNFYHQKKVISIFLKKYIKTVS